MKEEVNIITDIKDWSDLIASVKSGIPLEDFNEITEEDYDG